MKLRLKIWLGPALLAVILPATAFIQWTKHPPFEFTDIPFFRPIIHAFVPGFAETKDRIEKINARLEQLPEPTTLPTGGPTGYVSTNWKNPQKAWVRFEWDQPRRMDAIALVPAQSPNELTRPLLYTPLDEYRVTFFNDTNVVHRTTFTITGTQKWRATLPFFAGFPPVQANRVEVESVNFGPDLHFSSFGEIYIFSERWNIAPMARLSAFKSIETLLGIGLKYICDDRTSLGIPQKHEEHRFHGYSSTTFKSDTNAVWIELTLPEPHLIDEVRFYPIERELGVGQNTAGYPQEMDVSVRDVSSQTMRTVYQFKNELGESPGLNPVPLRFPETVTDRVRLNVTRLWKPATYANAILALSEIQLRCRGNLIESNIEATSSCMKLEMKPGKSKERKDRWWSIQGLTDGMSLEGRILHERDWLEQLAERADLLIERGQLDPQLTRLRIGADQLCWRLTTGIPLILFLGLVGWQTFRQHRNEQRLRDQLAADLHDDLGSNLSAISHYAQRLQNLSGADSRAATALQQLAHDSIVNLKEMVSFMTPRITQPKSLISVLKELASLHCIDIPFSFTVEPGLETIEFPPDVRRNIRSFLKEALNNAVRHSKADHIDIRIFRDNTGTVWLEVRDNGTGLPPEILADRNEALSTLRLRADDMHAEFHAANDIAGGCRIRVSLPKKA